MFPITIIIFGMLGILGAFIYAVGDVFLLAGKARLENYPKLQPYAKILSGAERMVALPHWRLLWGGLLGVFATPLVLMGFTELLPLPLGGDYVLMLPPFILFSVAAMIAPFVHGSFIYLGEYVQALNKVSSDSQPVIVEMLERHRKIMVISYAFLFACIGIASIWFSVVVGLEKTYLPVWMAGVNPITMFIAWMLIKRILPRFVKDRTEGAGFNIAYMLFFTFMTLTFLPQTRTFVL
ncbi:MAG TPA: DUF6796 family protein [Anaerolineales bacterium]|nr:DUF6796 family protein [Anaerolineales bacterium]